MDRPNISTCFLTRVSCYIDFSSPGNVTRAQGNHSGGTPPHQQKHGDEKTSELDVFRRYHQNEDAHGVEQGVVGQIPRPRHALKTK